MLTAGWGTDHVGEGRCKLHAGLSTGPKDQRGNKNALKHGLHERISFDTLTDEERDLAADMELDALYGAQTTYILLSIRERRVMQRIQVLRELGEDFVTTERTLSKGYNVKGPVDLLETTERPTEEQIARLEEILNTLAARKQKALEQLDKFAKTEPARLMDNLFAAIDRSLEAASEASEAPEEV